MCGNSNIYKAQIRLKQYENAGFTNTTFLAYLFIDYRVTCASDGRETGKSTLKLKNVYGAAPVLLKLLEPLRKVINLSFLLAQQHLICSNSCHTRNFNESFEYKNQTETACSYAERFS